MAKIRMGMVGGGEGAFIGAIHRMAAAIDGEIELVCGAFSSDPQRSIKSGKTMHLDPARCYPSYQQMFETEALLPATQRMDFVSIVTPNHLHFPVAKMAIEYGFHIMSDKPATYDLAEVHALNVLLHDSPCLYALTHTYTGYPMVKEARQRVASGQLGTLKKVVVEYPQGWLANSGDESSKQAQWRMDPKYSGISCCMGDIGVHAANLAEYVCGDEISHLCADIAATGAGRTLDDDGTVLLKFAKGARGVLLASQISIGEENNLKLRIYGDKASLEWSHQEPNSLWLKYADKPTQMLRCGGPGLSSLTMQNTRTPAGHPEGYIEAFANLYRNFANQIRAKQSGKQATEAANDVPGIYQAIRGMAFIQNVVAASESDLKWHPNVLQTSSTACDDRSE
ncbi:MAG: putative dehydrogenase [Paraglaciecola sp.]|jgi:predicted dehydrogenase